MWGIRASRSEQEKYFPHETGVLFKVLSLDLSMRIIYQDNFLSSNTCCGWPSGTAGSLKPHSSMFPASVLSFMIVWRFTCSPRVHMKSCIFCQVLLELCNVRADLPFLEFFCKMDNSHPFFIYILFIKKKSNVPGENRCG